MKQKICKYILSRIHRGLHYDRIREEDCCDLGRKIKIVIQIKQNRKLNVKLNTNLFKLKQNKI